jgi:hypothetical protein
MRDTRLVRLQRPNDDSKTDFNLPFTLLDELEHNMHIKRVVRAHLRRSLAHDFFIKTQSYALANYEAEMCVQVLVGMV